MKFGIAFANTGPFTQPAEAAAFAQAAEAAGFDSLWTVEHTVVPSGYESTYPYSADGRMPGSEDSPIPDPLVWLAFLAGVTETIRLGTGILILPQRNPLTLAKATATLDQMSNGRLDLGIGVGWLAEEFDALGVPFNERGARTDDHVEVLRKLWTGTPASHRSPFTTFEDCISQPTPAQPGIPIHVGGHTDVAARRAGRLGDGFFPASADPQELQRLIGVAHATAEDHDRDPKALEVSTMSMASADNAPAMVAAMAEAGVHRLIVPAQFFYRDTAAALARYGDEVIAAVG